MKFTPETLAWCRLQFPALARQVAGRPAVFFDGPGGTQVPQRVIDAVSHCLARTNANYGGHFATSREAVAMLDEAQAALADFVGTSDPDTIAFGQNMTSLAMSLARSLAKTWRPGDEIVVTQLDHDANVSPWTLAARDAGATVRTVKIRSADCTLDLDDLRRNISSKTRLVAVGCASNATGGINPVREIAAIAHDTNALIVLDAVHFAPHGLIDIEAWDCDFLLCSAYKFFGPHVGIMWGRRELLESLEAYRVRPAPTSLPYKWMTGTQNHEGIAGTLAAVEYLADVGRRVTGDDRLPRRNALREAYHAIGHYERSLTRQLLEGLARMPPVRVWGITDPERLTERVATVSFTHERLPAAELARRLGEQGFFVWHGNYYALNLTEALGLEPEGMLRVGLVHYNTSEEIQRLLAALSAM